ncbi:MAG: undecaprenyl/decaprenyl-phosphate alpha-N-acetylglucosaminyl 1-phosphate transferase [Clostridia bacterium]|nr:undecaprenyl/decaprenyl-phosphate alpha-N-acetylglucosaminyl 1-phosphate transferase [Clostridia bacterium]MCI1999985.1 undecaprenyl/decaprenyl-phosphate alpha-N-acetylglucosaminyl 1-phosphate transferase [Clostridia bacterium]MCI2014481.1 undecaprenyl/decaprenyl-phosphate alpha-N-acetylglucosaminyl 1-phosphate transferase [Clostridia bacterium]
MVHDWVLYIAAFSTAFAISNVMTPVAMKVSIKLGAIDQPKARGMHNKPMPRMGGLAIYLGFMLTVFLLYRFVQYGETRKLIGFMIGASIIVVLGMFDDVCDLPAKLKFFVQILAALVAIFSGIRIHVVMWPVTHVLLTLSGPITLLWIVGVTNAVNLIDGLDGLAAGVSSIAAICLMVLCILTGDETAVVLTAALAGSCLGFLPRNFNPAQIFMGDTGATFLGYTLAVTSILGVFKGYAMLALVVSMLCLGFPIFDTLFAIIRRLARRQPIMQADRGHLHHKLIDRGFSQKQAVMILYGISTICGVIAILLAIKNAKVLVVILLTIIVLSFLIYFFNHRRKNKEEHNNQ